MTNESETRQAVPAAFGAIALAAGSWDSAPTMEGSRALRHALDDRHPFNGCEDGQMVTLLDHYHAMACQGCPAFDDGCGCRVHRRSARH